MPHLDCTSALPLSQGGPIYLRGRRVNSLKLFNLRNDVRILAQVLGLKSSWHSEVFSENADCKKKRNRKRFRFKNYEKQNVLADMKFRWLHYIVSRSYLLLFSCALFKILLVKFFLKPTGHRRVFCKFHCELALALCGRAKIR